MMVSAALLLILGSFHQVLPESHSLTTLSTLINGRTPFPEFNILLLVNDVPVEKYDSTVQKIVPLTPWSSSDTVEDVKSKEVFVLHNKKSMQRTMGYMMELHRHSGGVQVCQMLCSCRLDNGSLTQLYLLDGYNGEEVNSYDALKQKQNTSIQGLMWNEERLEI
ncbi:class I histocompatibility antigen, F10 alpha chain-like, partial [Arapaima gigas]